MAAINKNFVIKNGVEIGDNLIYGNKDQLRVGIGTTVPLYTLDVRGGIGATSVSVGQTITAKVGIITTVQVGNLTVGEGLNFNSGIGTALNVSGVGTVGSLSIGSNQVISSGRELQNIASLDSTTTATIEAAIANAPNTFSDLTVTGIATFNNNVGVAGIVTAPAISVSWAQVGQGVTFTTGIGTFVNVTGIATITNLFVSGIASVGAAITMYGATGIISAYKFYGDGSGLTGTISGIGIRSEGADIGYGATVIDFKGPGVSTITSISAGIVTVFFEGGGGGSTIDKQTFNVGVAGTNLVTLTSPYTSGNIDVFLNGLKLIPTTDYTETSSNVITLATAAVNGDVIETISFRSIGSSTEIGLKVQQDSVGIGTSISTLNFVGGANTFFDRGNSILDVYISQGRINKQTFNVGAGGTTLLTLTEDYESGKIDIYRNGVRLASGDFTETSPNTVTLTVPANDGDVVEIQSFAGVVNTNTLSVLDNIKINTIGTATKLHVGSGTTFTEDLVVTGDARITGILTIGTGTITLDGSTNTINVGSGVTITGSGEIQATSITIGAGVSITSSGITGTASTISFATTAFNLVGSANTASFATTAFNLVGSANTASFATTSFGLEGSPPILVSNAGVNTDSSPTNLYVSGNSASNIISIGSTDGNTTLDFSQGNNFSLLLTGSIVLENPTGITTGQSGIILVQQDESGSRTVGFASHWDFPSATAPTLSTGANALDCLTYFVRNSTSIITNSLIGIGTL